MTGSRKGQSTMVTVEHMIDIALGSPEIGAVNFNVLHALLHVMAQQLDIQSCLIEFQGHDSERMECIINTARPGPILKLSEYLIDFADPTKICKKPPKCGTCEPEEQPQQKEFKKPCKKKDKHDESDKERKPKEKQLKKEKEDEEKEKADSGPEDDGKKKKKKEKPCPCKDKSDKSGVGAGDFEAAHSKGSAYYGSGMENCQTIVRIEPIGERCDTWRSRPALAHESMVKLEEKVTMLQEAFEAMEAMATNEDLMARTKAEVIGGPCVTPVNDMWQLYNLNKRMVCAEDGMGKLASMIEDILRETANYKEAMVMLASAVDDMEGDESDFDKMSPNQKLEWLKEQFEALLSQFKMLTDACPLSQLAAKMNAISAMQKSLDQLEAEWRHLLDCLGGGNVDGLIEGLKFLRTDVDNLNIAVAQFLASNRERELAIQKLKTEIEVLRSVKADKETMEDLLAAKADASVVNRKVSHDQFDAAVDDITKGLEDTLERLMAQEAIWNEAMDEVNKGLDGKLDKTEIMPLKEFISKKLRALQDKLKALAQMKKDAEAAGAKSRILRNLNCIACDADVVMKMDNMTGGQAPALQTSRSMRPYLAYELDEVRKAMKKGPTTQKDMTKFDELIHDNMKKNAGLPLNNRETVDHRLNKLDHLCNRYCGGSHTITTPQQRVTRIGHFLTEFGPQAVAMLTQPNLQQEKEDLSGREIPVGNPCLRKN